MSVDDEASFDLEWAWLETYSRWRSAMEAFAYPESRLLPSLFVPDFVASDRRLAPTEAFLALMSGSDRRSGLLSISRLTPDQALTLGETYLDQVKVETGAAEALKDVRLTNARSNAELDKYRDLCTRLASGPTGHPVTEERQIPQLLREIFWLVPMALARKLHDCGHYAAALDWYQTVFAYQLPADRRFIYHGLALEQSTHSVFGRLPQWLAFIKELNPHFTARNRNGAYTRFTLLSIVECFLAFADSEFARNAPDSNARARALYQAAGDLLDLPEVTPETGPDVPFPVNPTWQSLRARADTGLSKIHAGLNIAGQAELALDGTDTVLPSVYRYSVVVERAKALVAIAQQVESAYLSALERADAESYNQLQADHDLRAAQGTLAAQALRVDAALNGVGQAELQRDRAQIQFGAYDAWLTGGLNAYEEAGLRALGASVKLQDGRGRRRRRQGVVRNREVGVHVGPLRRPHGQCRPGVLRARRRRIDSRSAQPDQGRIRAARAGVAAQPQPGRQGHPARREPARRSDHPAADRRAGATDRRRTARPRPAWSPSSWPPSSPTPRCYEWMSGVLGRVYAYFLQQATALARLAQAQLAFERQEPVPASSPPTTGSGRPTRDHWRRADRGPARAHRLRPAAAGHLPARPARLRHRPAQAAPDPDAVARLADRRLRAAAVPQTRACSRSPPRRSCSTATSPATTCG